MFRFPFGNSPSLVPENNELAVVHLPLSLFKFGSLFEPRMVASDVWNPSQIPEFSSFGEIADSPALIPIKKFRMEHNENLTKNSPSSDYHDCSHSMSLEHQIFSMIQDPSKHFNDEVINLWFSLLEPSIGVLSSFTLVHPRAISWTHTKQTIGRFHKDLQNRILIPYNHVNHWLLLLIEHSNSQTIKVWILDSMASLFDSISFLQEKLAHLLSVPCDSIDIRYSFLSPHQLDHYSCGTFVCLYGWFLATRKFGFSDIHYHVSDCYFNINSYRRLILRTLLKYLHNQSFDPFGNCLNDEKKINDPFSNLNEKIDRSFPQFHEELDFSLRNDSSPQVYEEMNSSPKLNENDFFPQFHEEIDLNHFDQKQDDFSFPNSISSRKQ